MSAGRVRVGTHDIHDVQVFKLSSSLSSAAHLWCTHVHWAAMFGHRTYDFTSVSLNVFHASQNVCNRSAANVLILMGKRAILFFYPGFVKIKRSSVIFARQKKQCFFTLELQFLLCWRKYVLQCKGCTVLVIFGRILELCILYTGIVKRSSAKQNGCSGHLLVVGALFHVRQTSPLLWSQAHSQFFSAGRCCIRSCGANLTTSMVSGEDRGSSTTHSAVRCCTRSEAHFDSLFQNLRHWHFAQSFVGCRNTNLPSLSASSVPRGSFS